MESNAVKYPIDMDEELIPLCDALNKIPGLRTRFCCCGHGRDNFYVFAMAKTVAAARKFEKVFHIIGYWITVEVEDVRNRYIKKDELGIIARCNDIGMAPLEERLSVYAKLTKRAERIAKNG